MNIKPLSILLLLSVTCHAGITKNTKPVGRFGCGMKHEEVDHYYKITAITGNPKYDGEVIECDEKQQFNILPDHKWVYVKDLKVGNKMQSGVLRSTEKSIYFPITKIERVDSPIRTYTIYNCPFEHYPVTKMEIMTRNDYSLPERKHAPWTEEELDAIPRSKLAEMEFEYNFGHLRSSNPEKYKEKQNEFAEVFLGNGIM